MTDAVAQSQVGECRLSGKLPSAWKRKTQSSPSKEVWSEERLPAMEGIQEMSESSDLSALAVHVLQR